MTIEDLYRKCYGGLFGAGLNVGLPRDDAADLASEAFARLLTKDDPNEDLLVLIHRGLLLDHRRKRAYVGTSHERPVGLEVEVRAGQQAVNPVHFPTGEQGLFVREMREVLERCTPRERAAFTLHYVNGLTYEEVALRNGTSKQAAYQGAERARKRITEEVSA